MCLCPRQTCLTRPSRLLAITAAILIALALTMLLVLIVDHFDGQTAQAATIVYTCGPYPLQMTPWSDTCSVPKFDPALGTLVGVRFTTTVTMSGTMLVENLSTVSTPTFTGILTGRLAIRHPTTSQTLGSTSVTTTTSGTLASYDGAADFAGPSGRTINTLDSRTSGFVVTSDLTPWLGSSGTVAMPINTTSLFTCSFNPPSNNLCGSVTRLAAVITVTYQYHTPDLLVTKTHQGDFVVGAPGLYTISVRNVGQGPTIGPITATDILPTGLSLASYSGSGWTLAGASGQVVTFTRASALAPGSTSRILLTVNVTNTAIGRVTNTVAVTTTRDLAPANNQASDRTTVLAGVDLSVVKTVSRDPVTATEPISYTLRVSNAGPSTAPSVRVTDTLPAGMTSVSAAGAGWSCSVSGGLVVICTRTSLPIGTAPDIVITANAPETSGVITNTATVGSAGFDFVTANNTATVTTTVTAISDLSLTKSDSPDPVYAGTTLTYTLNVNNAGPSPANNVTLTDTLPAGATFLEASGLGWNCAPSGGDVICTRDTLAVGAAPALRIAVAAPGDTPITNTAIVGSNSVDLNPANNSASASTTVNPVANLALAKRGTPDPVVVGSPLTYTLSITNTGPNPTTSVLVTDTLPAGVAFAGASGSGWDCSQAGGVVTCYAANLAVGPAPDIVIQTTAPGVVGVFTNTASISSALPDLTPADNSVSITTTVVSALADLSITKSDDPDPVNIGSPLTYTLRVSNAGPNPATSVRVTDTLPSGVAVTTITAPDWACAESAGVVTCTLASLAVGVASDIVLRTTAPVISGTVANIASVASPVMDPNPSDNMVATLTNVYAMADLAISKQESADPIPTNTTLTYTLSVTNTGPNTATPVQVIDTLPVGVIFVDAAGSGWSCAQSNGVVTCTMPSLAVGPAPSLLITVTTPALAQTITNTATVASPFTDPNPANNTATATTVVSPADLVITKTDDQPNAVPGTIITYTIVVTNNGPGPVLGAVVSDTFPSLLAGVTWTCTATDGSTCPASGSGDISTTVNLADGGVATFKASGLVASDASGLLVNTATVSPPAGGVDPNPDNNMATDTDTLLPLADLILTQTDFPDPVIVDNFLRYRITVTNTGPSNATNVVITETLSSVIFDFASGDCTETGGALVCHVGLLTPGASRTINIYVIPTAAGVLVNTATAASAGEYDPTPVNNAAAETTTITGVADVSISKTDEVAAVTVSGPITYTIVVSNAGPHGVIGATVEDIFPSSLTGMTWTCAATGGSTCPASGSGSINATVTVTVGGTLTFTAVGTVAPDASGTLANTAVVTVPSSVTDTNTANNSATDTDTIINVPVTGGIRLYLPFISK